MSDDPLKNAKDRGKIILEAFAYVEKELKISILDKEEHMSAVINYLAEELRLTKEQSKP